MRRAVLASVLSIALFACGYQEPSPAPSKPAATASAAAGPLVLGARIAGDAPKVALADVAKNPGAYDQKVVTTSGTVTAVCQSMGCWMELKDDATPNAQAHVVMSGHSFFVPKTSSGHHARVQAKVLKTDESSECAQEAEHQTGQPVAKVQLEATGVELD